MKPFNLKEALNGNPVITRQGLRIVFLAHDPGAHPMCRVLARHEDADCVAAYNEDGRMSTFDVMLTTDLFMATTKREAWVNVYNWEVTGPYETIDKADRFATKSRIACCRIEWEE